MTYEFPDKIFTTTFSTTYLPYKRFHIHPERAINQTHIAPPSDDVEKIVPAERQVYNALVHGLAAPLGREVLLGDFRPAERPHREPDRLVPVLGVGTRRVTPSPATPDNPTI